MAKKRVLVAMSGGVDSAAAALLLQKQGYDCDGAMLKLYPGDDSKCCSAADAEDARAAAYRLGMHFYVFNETERFDREVMAPFAAAYAAGRTPNPCIDCNRCLKFGALLDRALTLGYDYVATGHYARVAYDAETGLYHLLRGLDNRKDQSYVLYQLTQRQLAHLLLPVGDYDKETVRAMVAVAGLLNARKRDSQDICFLPRGDYASFLERRGVALTEGDFVDEQGNPLGRHRGHPRYTTGQSKGLGIALGKRMYVLGKDPEKNTVTLGDDASLYRRTLTASAVNWIGPAPVGPLSAPCAAPPRPATARPRPPPPPNRSQMARFGSLSTSPSGP